MSFYSAFPTSPLSRSALASDTNHDQTSSSGITPRVFKAYGQISASPTSPLAPRRSSTSLDHLDDHVETTQQGHPGLSAASSLRHVSGPARLTRNLLASQWSHSSGTPFGDDDSTSPPLPSSSFTRSINTRRRSSGFGISASSPTPNFGSLIGSFQESLLRGRMSMPASRPVVFDAEIGVLGMGKCRPSLRCPPHVHVKFPAQFYDFYAPDPRLSGPSTGSTAALGSPYVGTIDLEAHYHDILLESKQAPLNTDLTGPSDHQDSVAADSTDLPTFPGYAVPPKGQVQLIVKYPDANAVKLFLVPYDLTDMQAGTKTFVRQKSVLHPSSTTSGANNESQLGSRSPPSYARQSTKEALRFAIHLQFCCPPAEPRPSGHHAGFEGPDPARCRRRSESRQSKTSGTANKSPKIFLHKTIRLVFGARALDSGEKLTDQIETPGHGTHRFSTYSGPEEDWHRLRREAKAAHYSAGQSRAAACADSEVTSASTVGRPRHYGLGIDIQSTASHTARVAADEGQEHTNVQPLNSDPNGERWQSPASQGDAQWNLGDSRPPLAAKRIVVSQGSGVDRSTGRWPRSVHGPGQEPVQQLARSLASSRLSDSLGTRPVVATHLLTTHTAAVVPGVSSARRATVGSRAESLHAQISLTDGTSSDSPVLARHRSRSPMLPPPRPSRIRSASTASLSEARVQSVFALGRLEEVLPMPAPGNSTSADSSFARRPSRAFTNVGADRPSLIRKLSEQFARSHTPSPTAIPKLGPAWRQADELAEISHDRLHDPDGDASDDSLDERITPLEEAALRRSTGSIR